jgi:pimeloyl-ACP methyl ester carboxylesterase
MHDMSANHRIGAWMQCGAVFLGLLWLSGCAMVNMKHVTSRDYVTERRADVLDAKRLSDKTVQALTVVAFTPDSCEKVFVACTDTLAESPGLNEEQRLSALSELWLAKAMKDDTSASDGTMGNAALDAFLQSARYAYAYLFYTARKPSERAFELRQAQVIDFYNFAVQRSVTRFFKELPQLGTRWSQTQLAGWTVFRPQTDVHLSGDSQVPVELIPAAGLRFIGLRNVYTRDGFGSEFVAVAPPEAASTENEPWREPDYASMTGVLSFDGATLADVLASKQVHVQVRDPYRDDSILLAGQDVPLAANFTAAYGVWLARSGFASQSIRSLLGREGGITTPRILMMQPYDPNRLIVVMLHGLASSPEAWINVSNEVLGDEHLRRNYQVLEVYYPTNAPVAVNLLNIRRALDTTLKHFDPSGQARASNNMVLVGHSMGGVIARLLVSSSGDALWKAIPVRNNLSAAKRKRLHERLGPYLQFSPMPQVTRAVFMASPHRGTPFAQGRLAMMFRGLIRLPANLLAEISNLSDVLKDASASGVLRVPNSIDNLSDKDPFIMAAADLPISPRVRYNSIVGVYKSNGPLATSSDGVVPYSSSHLAGAESELAVPSWHSVQENPAAILELRRILRLQETTVPGDSAISKVSAVR